MNKFFIVSPPTPNYFLLQNNLTNLFYLQPLYQQTNMMLFTPVINRIDTVKQQQLYFHHENQVPPEPTKPENNKPFSAEQVVTTQEKVLDQVQKKEQIDEKDEEVESQPKVFENQSPETFVSTSLFKNPEFPPQESVKVSKRKKNCKPTELHKDKSQISKTIRKKRKTKDTKNIPKNFAKAIINYAWAAPEVLEPYFSTKKEIDKFLNHLNSKKRKITNIKLFHNLINDKQKNQKVAYFNKVFRCIGYFQGFTSQKSICQTTFSIQKSSSKDGTQNIGEIS